MRSKVVWALVALNVVLLGSLVAQWLKPNAALAQAQVPRPSDYILIPGSVQGNPAQVVYMIDTTNGWLSARTFTGQALLDMPPISLNRYFNQTAAQPPKKGGRIQ
jgi:hypothetical protein